MNQEERIEFLNKYKLILALMPVFVLGIFALTLIGIDAYFLLLIDFLAVYVAGIATLSKQKMAMRIVFAFFLFILFLLGMGIVFVIYFNDIVVQIL